MNEYGDYAPPRPGLAGNDLPVPQPGYPQHAPARHTPRKIAMTGAEAFWYVVGNIAFGASYMCKVPAKKALVDYGLVPELTGAEQFWYVVMNIFFGAGYLAKVITSKALSEMPQFAQARQQQTIQAHTPPPGALRS